MLNEKPEPQHDGGDKTPPPPQLPVTFGGDPHFSPECPACGQPNFFGYCPNCKYVGDIP